MKEKKDVWETIFNMNFKKVSNRHYYHNIKKLKKITGWKFSSFSEWHNIISYKSHEKKTNKQKTKLLKLIVYVWHVFSKNFFLLSYTCNE